MNLTEFEDLFGTVDQQAGVFGPVPDASSGDGVIRTEEQCKEWAEKLDCDLRVATDRELFVDIDTETNFKVFENNFKVLKKHWDVGRVEINPSKQGLPHRHIVVHMKDPIELMTRVALQAALGSDPMRELLSARRALDKEENVVIFFEKRTS